MLLLLVTEEEIEASGMLDGGPYKSHSLAFIRSLQNINIDHKKSWRFIDQSSDGTVDEEAQGVMEFCVESKCIIILIYKIRLFPIDM